MTHTTFTTIDVNTANPDPSSICQVGIALYFGSKVAEQFTTRIDPEDYFDPANVQVHRIDKEGIEGAPTFEKVAPVISRFIDGEIVVSYGPLTRKAIEKAYQKTNVPAPDLRWIDCRNVIRRTWPKLRGSGDELENACGMIRYSYIPGDALQDALAIGEVFIAAIKESGYTAEAWAKVAKRMR